MIGQYGREGDAAMMLTRFLWVYLVLVVVFAFGFLCASAFSMEED